MITRKAVLLSARPGSRGFTAAAALLITVAAGTLIHSAAAQSRRPDAPYALIFGTVWKDKVPAYGVRVKIRRANEKKARWEQVSDHNGEFAQRVPAGTADYVVWADVKAPKGKPRPETKVHIDNDERTDIAVHLTE